MIYASARLILESVDHKKMIDKHLTTLTALRVKFRGCFFLMQFELYFEKFKIKNCISIKLANFLLEGI